VLLHLSGANDVLRCYKEGEKQAKEALEVYERLGDTVGQAECLGALAISLHKSGQLDAAEEVASRAINLLPKKGNQFLLSRCHRSLAAMHWSKGDIEKAILHSETALGIASFWGWYNHLHRDHYFLATLFCTQGRFDDANAHVELANSHTVNNPFELALSMYLQAGIWLQQFKFEQAKSKALHAVEIFEKLGAVQDLETCRQLLRIIDLMQEEIAGLSLVVVNSWKSATPSAC